jgi:uncharacterized protein YecE (DUF72 family)
VAQILVGVSGWSYPHWRGGFYPAGLPHHEELHHLSTRLGSVEINASFYALQSPSRYAGWRDAVGPGFRFAVKGSRYITHQRRLNDPEPGLANFFASGPLALGAELGPFLWQLPASLHFDARRVADFLQALPGDTDEAAALATTAGRHVPAVDPVSPPKRLRHALEVRHESYRDPGFAAMLGDLGVAVVLADSAGEFPGFQQITADFAYVRLHGPQRIYHGSYGPDAIRAWAGRLRRWRDEGLDCYVYFDNDADGAAPFDAMALAQAL